MIKTKKIFLTLFLAVFLVLILEGSFVFAQEAGRGLEIEYPEAFGEAPRTVETSLPEYVKYIFNFSIMIAGLVAFGALVAGGIRYLTSAGAPAVMADAKDQILAAFLGLIILLCSYLILVTINPQLRIIKITKAPLCNCELPRDEWRDECKKYCSQLKDPFRSFGVYLIKDGYKEGDKCIPDIEKSDCLRILGEIPDLGIYGFNDKAKQIKFTNSPTSQFGAILHEDKDFKNQCRIFFEKPGEEFQTIPGKDKLGKVNKPSSATVFLRGEGSEGGYVELCSNPDFTGCERFDNTKIVKEESDSPQNLSGTLNDNVRSVKIEGKYLVVLFENPAGGEDFPGKCEAFRQSDSDLKDNPIGKCGTFEWKFGFIPWYTYKPCASAVAIYPIR